MIAKVEWHQGELFPRVGFIVTNLSYPPKGIVRFYNGRGTAEQWIRHIGARQVCGYLMRAGQWPLTLTECYFMLNGIPEG